MTTSEGVDGWVVGVTFNSVSDARGEESDVWWKRAFEDWSRKSWDLIVFRVFVEEACIPLLTEWSTEIEMQETFTFGFSGR
jgi:hypothetical protein